MTINDEFFEECKRTSAMSRQYNWYWYRLNNRDTIGDCTYLYFKHNPKTYEDFYYAYTTDLDGDIRHRGRSEEELWQLAERYKEISNGDLPIETFFKNVIWHIIIQSVDGHKREAEIIEYGRSKGYEMTNVDSSMDAELGVDIEAKKDGITQFFIQVKPITFIRGNNNKSLINDRVLALQKKEKIRDKYGVDVFLAMYEVNGNEIKWFRNKKNGILHKFKFFDKNGVIFRK